MTTASLTLSEFRQFFNNFSVSSLAVPAVILLIITMLVLPLPPLMLDVLFTLNILLALVTIMVDAGINDGDILVVDRSLEAKSRDVVIAIFEGNLTVKRLIIRPDGSAILKAENHLYKNILISEYTELEIWGVVTSAIHQFIK